MQNDFLGELWEIQKELSEIPLYEKKISDKAELRLLGGISMIGIGSFLLSFYYHEGSPHGALIGLAGIGLGAYGLYIGMKQAGKDLEKYHSSLQ